MRQSTEIAAFVVVYTDNSQTTIQRLVAKANVSTLYDKSANSSNPTTTGQQVFIHDDQINNATAILGAPTDLLNLSIVSGSETETDGELTLSGSFRVEDLDTKDTVQVQITDVGLGGTFEQSSSTLPSSLSANNRQALIEMVDLVITPGTMGSDGHATDQIVESVDADTAASGSSINWTFTSSDSGDSAFDFLQEGETLVLTTPSP